MTVDEARGILLSFAGAEEGAHHGHTDFRVGGKIYATLQPDKGLAVFRLPMEMAEALAASTLCFRLVSRFGGKGWLSVAFADAEPSEFQDLATAAWQLRTGP